MGKGEVMPLASRADTMSDGTPRTAKEGAEAGIETLSGYGGSTGVCLGNHQALLLRRGWTCTHYRHSA